MTAKVSPQKALIFILCFNSGAMTGRGGFSFREAPDDVVENGGEKNSKKCHAQHPAENSGAQGAPHFRAGAFGQNQRHDAENKGEGRHQDRTEAQTAGFDGGFHAAQAGILPLFGEFDDEDGVFAGQADQDDKSDLGENIVVHSAGPDAQNGKKQAHGDNQDDGQGERPAFVERRQCQEDKEDAQREDEDGGVALQNFLVGQFRPFKADGGREFFAHQSFHGRNGLAGTDAAGGVAGDLRGGIHVVADDAVRAVDAADGNKGAEGDHGALAVAGFEVEDVGRFASEGAVGLGGDMVSAAEKIQIVDVKGAEVNLERVKNIGQRHAHRLGLEAVHVEIKLRGGG